MLLVNCVIIVPQTLRPHLYYVCIKLKPLISLYIFATTAIINDM